jgi:undecaprenyl-diphosphatase
LTFFEAVFLGIVQGLTEFLPISSTGHLTVAGKLMNLISEEHPERWTAFIAIIQLGTLIAVIVYFWKDLMHIIIEFIRDNITSPKNIKFQSTNSRLGWMIIAGSIPVAAAGILFKDTIEGAFTKNLYVISGSLIVLALFLYLAEKTAEHKKQITDITFVDALIVGVAQAISLIPGSSRSGTTITGGLFAGFTRETAARFSFLLGIPAILASGIVQSYEAMEYIDSELILDFTVASIMAAISGYFSIDFLLKFLKKNTTFIFIYYRIILGVVILILLYFDIINP